MSKATSVRGATPRTQSLEHERVDLLRALFEGGTSDDAALLGIGDDAAILAAPPERLVWSIDAQVEERHFRRAWMGLDDVGYRATMAAFSDLAAMGARPLGALSALELPLETSDEELVLLAGGQRLAAAELGTRILGGNMARADVLAITTSVLGAADKPIRRGGSAPGDDVWVAGALGHAAVGLELHLRGARAATEAEKICDLAFRRPRALVREGCHAAARGASAMIDISDGLAADLAHLARASAVTLVLDADALADPLLARCARDLGTAPLSLVLSGGEDYALVATAPRGVMLEGFRRIGHVVAGEPVGVLIDEGGSRRAVDEHGFDHFRPR